MTPDAKMTAVTYGLRRRIVTAARRCGPGCGSAHVRGAQACGCAASAGAPWSRTPRSARAARWSSGPPGSRGWRWQQRSCGSGTEGSDERGASRSAGSHALHNRDDARLVPRHVQHRRGLRSSGAGAARVHVRSGRCRGHGGSRSWHCGRCGAAWPLRDVLGLRSVRREVEVEVVCSQLEPTKQAKRRFSVSNDACTRAPSRARMHH